MTRFFATLAMATLLCTRGLAQSSSQADGALFEIKPHHTGISVPNLEESIACGNAFELIQYKRQ